MKNSLLAAALFALALTACGKKEEAASQPAIPAAAEPATAPLTIPAPPAAETSLPGDAAKPADSNAPGTPDASLKMR